MVHDTEQMRCSPQGSYAFILYDRSLKRIVAGRSPDGAENLFWAAGTDKNSLMFSSNRLALFKHGEAVTEFPSKFVGSLPLIVAFCNEPYYLLMPADGAALDHNHKSATNNRLYLPACRGCGIRV